ncbi:MAG: 30S ribosome-binding factor RbfA [Candidatus Aminicenantes bacterium]|nr:MAG: 30S ribosome-binding factor RbfA [Candidatus Aminicenantes bacterium]
MSHRKERFSSTLKQCLADILVKDINNPLLKSAFISNVIVSNDLKKAEVFVSLSSASGHGGADIDDLVSRLTKSRGFIKRTLAKRMYLKYIPELVFIKDEIMADRKANRIETVKG